MKTRLQAAYQELRAALEEEKARIEAALTDLEAWVPTIERPPSASLPSAPAVATYRRRRAPKDETKAKRPPPFVPRPAKKALGLACSRCRRSDLKRAKGRGGKVSMHYADPCQLPCAGGVMSGYEKEDLADGIHQDPQNCPKCAKRATA